MAVSGGADHGVLLRDGVVKWCVPQDHGGTTRGRCAGRSAAPPRLGTRGDEVPGGQLPPVLDVPPCRAGSPSPGTAGGSAMPVDHAGPVPPLERAVNSDHLGSKGGRFI